MPFPQHQKNSVICLLLDLRLLAFHIGIVKKNMRTNWERIAIYGIKISKDLLRLHGKLNESSKQIVKLLFVARLISMAKEKKTPPGFVYS